MRRESRNRGITLIALIITIIVMLILVAVTVNVALSGGLFGTAQDASIRTEMEIIRERAENVKATLYANSVKDNNVKFDTKTYKLKLQEEFKDSELGLTKVIVENRKYDIIILDGNLNIEVRIHSDDDSFLAKTDIASGENVYNKYIEWDDVILAGAEVGTKQEIVEGFLAFYINYANVKEYNGTVIHENLEEWIQDEENKIGKEIIGSMFGIDISGVTTKSEFYQKLIKSANDPNVKTEEECIEAIYNSFFEGKTEKEICSNSWVAYIYKDGTIADIKANIDVIDLHDSKDYVFKEKGNYEIVIKSITGQELAREKMNYTNIIDNNYEFFLEAGDQNWETDGNGTITKCKLNESTKEIVIPYKIGNEKIIGIGGGTELLSYQVTEQLEKIIIPNGVKQINAKAFSGCNMLQSISLPSTLTHIGAESFANGETSTPSEMSTTLIIPGGVEYIGDYAFAYSGATKIVCQEGVKTIGNGTFWGCRYLKEIILPDTLENIQNEAFEGTVLNETETATITIPANVTNIGNMAFILSKFEIEVDENNKVYSSQDGVLFNKEKTELISFPTLRKGSYTVPNSVKTIGSFAFYTCFALEEIILPEGLERIETKGLRFGESYVTRQTIEDITIPNSVVYIGEDAIGDETKNIYFAPGDNPIPEGRPWGADSANIQKLEN